MKQPIETAPKDGRPLVLYSSDGRPAIGHWVQWEMPDMRVIGAWFLQRDWTPTEWAEVP